MTHAKSYSAGDPAMLDLVGRGAQAEKILAVVEHFASSGRTTGRDPAAWHCLDVGCSAGVMTRALADRHALAIGVDVDLAALRYFSAQRTGRGCPVAASALALPWQDESFDLAICNQVYQYVPDVAALFAEIHRVLRPGGFCFFSTRNLWGLAARENRLPWLSALAPWAIHWMERRSIVRADWRHTAGRLWPYRRVRDLAGRYFTVIDYTTRVLSVPGLAKLFLLQEHSRTLAWLLGPILPLAKPILPTHLWILEKALNQQQTGQSHTALLPTG